MAWGDVWLKAIPAFGPLNVIVRTAAADRLTNGAFELALSFHLAAVVRQLYDFPDFDQVAADGGVSSVLLYQAENAAGSVVARAIARYPPQLVCVAGRVPGLGRRCVCHATSRVGAGRATEVSRTHQRQRLRYQQEIAAQAGLELTGFRKPEAAGQLADRRVSAACGGWG